MRGKNHLVCREARPVFTEQGDVTELTGGSQWVKMSALPALSVPQQHGRRFSLHYSLESRQRLTMEVCGWRFFIQLNTKMKGNSLFLPNIFTGSPNIRTGWTFQRRIKRNLSKLSLKIKSLSVPLPIWPPADLINLLLVPWLMIPGRWTSGEV